MERGFSCTQCGYPLDVSGDGAGGNAKLGRTSPNDACPECGTSAAHSRERWIALGGETAALDRLIRGASLVTSLAMTLAVIEALRPLLLRGRPPISDLSKALHWSLGLVTLTLGVAGWIAWRSAERAPPFALHSRIPFVPKVLLGVWWVAAAGVLVWSVAPHVFDDGAITIYLLSLLMWVVLLPTSIALATLAHGAGPAPPFWRRRQMPARVIAWILIALIVLHVLLAVAPQIGIVTDAAPEVRARWSRVQRIAVEGRAALSSLVVPIVLMALAAAQLALVSQAAAAIRRPATLAEMRHVLLRRTWVGVLVLPAVLFFGVTYVHAFIFGPGGSTRLAVMHDDPAMLFVGALGAIAVLWFAAALAPLYVVRRAIAKATRRTWRA